MDFMGQILGSTFNVIFLALSAFLFGLSWQKKDYPKYGISFITKRLSLPYIIRLRIYKRRKNIEPNR